VFGSGEDGIRTGSVVGNTYESSRCTLTSMAARERRMAKHASGMDAVKADDVQ